MLDLAETQKRFQQFILHKKNTISTEITSTAPVSVTTRLEIYQEAYYLRLLDALKQDYPVLMALLGDEAFELLGYQYVSACPSYHRSIRWFGGLLSQFIGEQIKPHKHLIWQKELATFEWLLTVAFDAADSQAVLPDDMVSVPFEKWPEMYFYFHPSLQQVTLHWNIAALWHAFKEKGEIIKPLRMNKPLTWMIWRKELDIHFRSVTPDEMYVIKAMRAGENFGTVCEGLCRLINSENVATHAAILLKRFMLDHWLTGVNF